MKLEVSNYLWEMYYGGWAAPNIYFLGFAGVVKFGNLRIGGLSGIYKQPDFLKGHFDRPPYNGHTIRSVYHVREYDFHKLMQVEEPVDIFLSHDCPVGITDCGDWKELVREKPDFKQEVQERNLGSKPAAQLLEKLKPPYWFSADLHCKFAARVQHGEDGPALHPEKTVVWIYNNLGPGLDLTIHYKSKNDDLGTHVIPYQSNYQWSFHVNFWETTPFFCELSWQEGSRVFDIFVAMRDEYRCPY
ncbi:hypothetical protein FF1_012982 [Malus domestica]